MPKFIECFDVKTDTPVAININTIARVYAEPDGQVWLVLTTISTEWYEDVDDDTLPAASKSDRVKVKGTYLDIMRKIALPG